jgi:hypothetical protein
MPPESDTIEIQMLDQRQESLGPEAQINREMDGEDYPATPTHQQARQASVFEIPILPPTKRQANFSPETTYRGRNPFQNSSTPKPVAKNSEQAIYWARDLILQASTMAESHVSQDKLLELLDVFRDYTEKGRVANQFADKLSAKLAYHSATLATASQQATKTLKKATTAATTAALTSSQPTQKPKASYAAIAATNATSQPWITVQPRKKPAPKKPAAYYQMLLTLAEGQPTSPLLVRNKINQAFQKAGITGPVVKEVAISRKNNLILTTTEGYSGEFLLQQINTWQDQLQVKRAQPIEAWTKIVVHGVPTTFEGAETLQILHNEIPTYNKQNIVGNPYWLSKDWKSKQTSSIVVAFKTEEEAKKIGSRITILGQSLRTERYRSTPPTTQCSNCQAFGHNANRCRNQAACQLCAESHTTTQHNCSSCSTKGKPCRHTLPKCCNCKKPHFANSKDCEIFLAITKRSPQQLS